MKRDQPSAADVRGQSLQPVEAARAGDGRMGAQLWGVAGMPVSTPCPGSGAFIRLVWHRTAPEPLSTAGPLDFTSSFSDGPEPLLALGPLERAVGVWPGLGGYPVKSPV